MTGKVGEELFVEREEFGTHETLVGINLLVVRLRVFDHEVHRQDGRRAVAAIHFSGIDDALVCCQVFI